MEGKSTVSIFAIRSLTDRWFGYRDHKTNGIDLRGDATRETALAFLEMNDHALAYTAEFGSPSLTYVVVDPTQGAILGTLETYLDLLKQNQTYIADLELGGSFSGYYAERKHLFLSMNQSEKEDTLQVFQLIPLEGEISQALDGISFGSNVSSLLVRTMLPFHLISSRAASSRIGLHGGQQGPCYEASAP